MSGAAKFYPGGKGVKEEKKEHAILYKFVAEPNSKPLQLGFDGNFISVSEVKEVIADQKRMDPHDIDLLPHDPQATPLGENLPTIAEESGFDDHQRGAGHSTGGPAAVPYRNEERLVHATLVWVKRRPALKSRIGTIEVDAVSRGFKPTPMSPSSGDDDEELVEHEEDVYPHAWPKDFICQICRSFRWGVLVCSEDKNMWLCAGPLLVVEQIVEEPDDTIVTIVQMRPSTKIVPRRLLEDRTGVDLRTPMGGPLGHLWSRKTP